MFPLSLFCFSEFMKVQVSFLLVGAMFAACSQPRTSIDVKITNKLDTLRSNELVEIPFKQVIDEFGESDSVQFVIVDKDGKEVPYQISYDENVIFPVSVGANSSVVYTIRHGIPKTIEPRVQGHFYAFRNDDITWENELAIYRCFGPTQQMTKEPKYGYDYWCKDTTDLVSEDRYIRASDPELQSRIDLLETKGQIRKAKALKDSMDFYHDHGDGLDCFKVGRTLGLAGTALMADSVTLIPSNAYSTYEILDNGPLRFTVALTYPPIKVDGDSSIVEKRIISLDAGCYFNKVQLSFGNLKEVKNICTGIVLNGRRRNKIEGSVDDGFMAFRYRTQNYPKTGDIYTGAIFVHPVLSIEENLFKTSKQRAEHDGNFGYLQAISQYTPGDSFVYYFGASWSKYGLKSFDEWVEHIRQFNRRLVTPLKVSIVEKK